ncbi:MAG: hypothetical protein Q8K94_00315 [Moraxellaceae bacterium]|nr:hypothetical protein [Moraxellaceae bacterium]MDP1775037.1 hypothetical protein [Moraxellaceae bacterium]
MVRQSGHILWSLLLLLGLMTELTLSVVHEVASQSLTAQRFSQQIQAQGMINAVFAQLESLPIPAVASSAALLWHPQQANTKTVCGQRIQQSNWLGADCTQSQPAWQWWLGVEQAYAPAVATGTDSALTAHQLEQFWWLRVSVQTTAGKELIIQQQYRQTVRP